jgi:hypothetical protein
LIFNRQGTKKNFVPWRLLTSFQTPFGYRLDNRLEFSKLS